MNNDQAYSPIKKKLYLNIWNSIYYLVLYCPRKTIPAIYPRKTIPARLSQLFGTCPIYVSRLCIVRRYQPGAQCYEPVSEFRVSYNAMYLLEIFELLRKVFLDFPVFLDLAKIAAGRPVLYYYIYIICISNSIIVKIYL